ncbi:spore coat protein U domain-containing protein [Acinetobacter sp. TSRC1-2]|uniref:spore coat protein U domain-containing protein n=1 Tax=unclassified Acinetobacter TaxID=196816 RepID=UPI003CF97F6A
MNSFFKITSAFLLCTSALATHAATQRVTVNYTLTVPPACTLSSNGTAINKVLPHDGTAVNQNIDVKCNVPYNIQAKSANSKGANLSAVVNTTDSTRSIPYNIKLSGGPNAVNVNNGTPVNVQPSATTKTDNYTLTANTSSPVVTADYMAGAYTDNVTLEISY